MTDLRGEEIVRAGEPVDFFGILIQGSAFVLIEHRNMKTLKIGDMIGHMVASDFTSKENHPATVVATIDGLIAVLPFGELKGELRRAPDAVFKVY
jgi:CRP-like cAMP-binding protein